MKLPSLPVPKNQKTAAQLTDPRFRVAMNQKSEDEVELFVFENIGEDFFGGGVTAQDVVNFLSENEDKSVHVRINSPGGLAFDGITIYNALKDHAAGVSVTIEGLAGSAAAIIAFAGKPLRQQETAQLFVHKAWTIAMGNSDDMLDTAEFLDKLDQSIAKIMARRTGKSPEEMMTMLKGKVDGQFLTAEEALEAGLIDEIIKDEDDVEDDDTEPQEAAESRLKARENLLRIAQSKLDLIKKDLRNADV